MGIKILEKSNHKVKIERIAQATIYNISLAINSLITFPRSLIFSYFYLD